MLYPDEEKGAFYEKLAEVGDRAPMEDKLFIPYNVWWYSGKIWQRQEEFQW